MSRVIVLLLRRSQYVPHLTPHVPLLAFWGSLISWSSNCDALLEILHIIRCKIFVCYQAVLCVFSQEQIGRGHVYIKYTQKVLKILLVNTPKKYCAGEMRIHYFSGQVFLYVLQTKMVIASGGENNVSLRHSPRHLLPGGEPCTLYTCVSHAPPLPVSISFDRG